MLVDGSQRIKFQGAGDFLEAGRVAVLVHEADEVIENLLLAFGQCHKGSAPIGCKATIGEEKAKSQAGRWRRFGSGSFACSGNLLRANCVSLLQRCSMQNLGGNLRYALRQFRLSPVFKAAAVLTLALG